MPSVRRVSGGAKLHLASETAEPWKLPMRMALSWAQGVGDQSLGRTLPRAVAALVPPTSVDQAGVRLPWGVKISRCA
jgi:hypothetical protein